jgi:hypothetical protein
MSGSPTHASRIASENVWGKTRLVMLGTIHRELSGGDALAQWLGILRPDVITLEFSEYGLWYRKTHSATLLRRLDGVTAEMEAEGEPVNEHAIEAMRSYIGLPYEYVVASTYTEGYGLPLFLVDLDELSCLKLQGMGELINRDNLRLWFDAYEAGVSQGGREQLLARLFFDKGTKTFPYTEEMLMRDRQIKERVSALMAGHHDKRFVHVCGWQHLADPKGIYAPLNPVKVFAHDRPLCV